MKMWIINFAIGTAIKLISNPKNISKILAIAEAQILKVPYGEVVLGALKSDQTKVFVVGFIDKVVEEIKASPNKIDDKFLPFIKDLKKSLGM